MVAVPATKDTAVGTAHTTTPAAAMSAAVLRRAGRVMAQSRVTRAPPSTPIQARLSPVPGQSGTACDCAKATVTPTAANAVARPAAATRRDPIPTLQRRVIVETSASTASGAASQSTQEASFMPRSAGQPAWSMVGRPASSDSRPAASAVACGATTIAPGSDSSAHRVPCAACQIARGANTTTAGTSTQTMRTAPRIERRASSHTMATSQSSTNAGASEGAQASAAAVSRDAAPAAPQERWATRAVWSTHGSSRCSSTAAGRPSARAIRKVGASAHTTPARMRSPGLSVIRVAANQPPSTASGRAATQSSSSA